MTTTAITQYENIKSMLKSHDVLERFQEIMGEKAQAFLASVLSTVYTDERLSNCDPLSILYAAMKAATLDLPVEPNIGQSFIIPYKSKAVFQIGYKGIIQLALRTKEYATINATEVYEGERIKENRLTGEIILNGTPISDKVIGYCSYFEMKSGYKHYLYMTVEEMIAYAKRYSPAWKIDGTLWHTDFDLMAQKTVLKQLLTKYGELRIDRQSSQLSEVLKEDDAIDVEGRDITQPEPEPETEEKPKRGRPKKEEDKDAKDAKDATVQPPDMPPEEIATPTPEQRVGSEPPITLSLVASGYFASETMAKTALRFYTGLYVWDNIVAWVKLLKEWMDKGESLSQAAAKANQDIKP